MDTQRLMSTTNYILNIAREKLSGYSNRSRSSQKSETIEDNKEASIDKYQPIERLFVWIQRIIYWHEPIRSLITIIFISTTFLLFSLYEPRFYPSLAICVFIYNFTVFWFNHVWPEIKVEPQPEDQLGRWTHLHPQFMTISEFNTNLDILRKYFLDNLNKLIELRAISPIKFCICSCLVFTFTAAVGQRISGLNLILSILFTLIVAPGFYLHVFPIVKSYYDYNMHFLNVIPALVPYIAQSTNRSPTRDQSSRKSGAFDRRKSSVDAMTPIIEEDITSSPFIAIKTKNNDALSLMNLSDKLQKQNMNQRFDEQGSDYLDEPLSNRSVSTQQQQSGSSNSSSGSHLCSDDGSLIDMDDVQHDDFVIL